MPSNSRYAQKFLAVLLLLSPLYFFYFYYVFGTGDAALAHFNRISVTEWAELMDLKHAASHLSAETVAEERAYPLAFTIKYYRNPKQLLQLLRLLYRPYNVYCLHVDLKTPQDEVELIKQFTSGRGNVIYPERVDVEWGMFSTVEMELRCMSELMAWRNGSDEEGTWRSLYSLTAEELPLRTNLELVRLSRVLAGANWLGVGDVESRFQWRMNVDIIKAAEERQKQVLGRLTNSFMQLVTYVAVQEYFDSKPVEKVSLPLADMRLCMADAGGVYARSFVDYMMNNSMQSYWNWWRRRAFADEHSIASLHCSGAQLNITGAYVGARADIPPPRVKVWQHRLGFAIPNSLAPVSYHDTACHGQYVHDICIFSKEDVEGLISQAEDRRQLFLPIANKFHMHMFPSAVQRVVVYLGEKENLLNGRRPWTEQEIRSSLASILDLPNYNR